MAKVRYQKNSCNVRLYIVVAKDFNIGNGMIGLDGIILGFLGLRLTGSVRQFATA